jgi:hypothetical protein
MHCPGAEKTTVKAVREYERKFRHRPAVLKEITRALHQVSDPPSPDAGAAPPAAARDYEQPLVVG